MRREPDDDDDDDVVVVVESFGIWVEIVETGVWLLGGRDGRSREG